MVVVVVVVVVVFFVAIGLAGAAAVVGGLNIVKYIFVGVLLSVGVAYLVGLVGAPLENFQTRSKP